MMKVRYAICLCCCLAIFQSALMLLSEWRSVRGLIQNKSPSSSEALAATTEELERRNVNAQIRKELLWQISQSPPNPFYQQRWSLYDQHPALRPDYLVPELVPPVSWADRLPDLNIIGLAKAGTSQLYRILQDHPRVVSYGGFKESCLNHRGPLRNFSFMGRFKWWNQIQPEYFTAESSHRLQKFLYNYFENNKEYSNSPKYVTVNGCLSYSEIFFQIHFLKQVRNKKFLILFRDPADWLWATWNFWWDAKEDARPPASHDWAGLLNQYRSPELFHEYIASAGRLLPSEQLLDLRRETIFLPRLLRHLVGKHNVLLIKNEDMLPSNIEASGLLKRLANFTGLSQTGFENNNVTKRIGNCGDQKGEKSDCGSTTSSRYAIAGHREILPETRDLIYILFYEECRLWRDEFGIRYDQCLEATSSLLQHRSNTTTTTAGTTMTNNEIIRS